MSLTEATQAKVDIKHYGITDVRHVNFKVDLYLQETENKLLSKYIIKLTPHQTVIFTNKTILLCST